MSATAMSLAPTCDADVERVAAYLRVSTERQTEANQRPEIEQLIAMRFPRAHVTLYAERKSAAKVRPEYERMLNDAKAGKFDVLVVWAIDRFGRSMAGNLNDVLALDAAGVRVISCRESWLDMNGPFRTLLVAIFSWAAEQERGRIRERIAAGQARVLAHGGTLGRPAFGLRRVREAAPGLPRGVPRVVLDDAARPTLLRMAQLLIETGTLRDAALRLQAEMSRKNGDLSPSPKSPWDHIGLKRILLNEDLRRLGAWSPELLARVDAILKSRRRTPRGAATPAHLASSFLACGACGGSLTCISSKKGGASYVCSRSNTKGKAACPGIGYKSEAIVDRALCSVVHSAIDGDIKERALRIVRQRLESRPLAASEREAVVHALSRAEREGELLAKAIAKGGNLDALVKAVNENDQQTKQLRARVARLDAAPAPLEPRRRIQQIERYLSNLSKILSRGGIDSRPAVDAVLRGRRLTVTPVLVAGQKRWRVAGQIPAGYLATIDGAEASGFCPSCGARSAWPGLSLRRRPASPAR